MAAPIEEFHDLFPLVLCLALAVWLGHVVHCRRIAVLTEATVSLLLGLVAGGATVGYFIWWRKGRIPTSLAEFNTEIFFDALLPPIIFNAGFSAKKKSFFRNFVTLVLFGVVGTFVTSALIAVGCNGALSWLGISGAKHLLSDSLTLGTVFSSSDSVATLQILDPDDSPMLYSLIFGEGVVNDASSIVLLRAVQKISRTSQLNADTLLLIVGNFMRLFILSLLLGVGVGLASAYIVRRSFALVHHSTDREVAMVALLGFVAYLLAEELGLSGIFSVFFCGITMSHYTWHALSPSAKVVTVYLFRILSFTSELFLFLYAGFSMWSNALWRADLGGESLIHLVQSAGTLAAILVLLVLAGRALTIAPLALLANTWRPPGCKITVRQAAVIWWSGSMRGAVTVAMTFQSFSGRKHTSQLAKRDDQKIVVASNAAVIFITVVMGGMTSRLFKWLLAEEEGTALSAQHSTLATYTSLGSDGISAPLLTQALQRHLHWNRKSHVYAWWHKLDENVLHPLFGGRPSQAAGYHSPPPSPGRAIINRVMGPSILKRLTPVPPPAPGCACPPPAAGTGNGAGLAEAAVEAAETAGPGQELPPAPPAPAPAAPKTSPPSRGKPPRHPDPFRLWPAPSEPQLGDGAAAAAAASAAVASAATDDQAARAPPAGTPPRPSRTVSRRNSLSLRPDAVEMHPSSALEELFSMQSGRLDSAASQQVDWADSAEFGEAAFLAAGAPGEGGASADVATQGPQASGPPQLTRASPFQQQQQD